jgi:amidophosphoribosyltransferase
MCGFIGLLGAPSAVSEIYDGLTAVQHRGQDSAGIVTHDGDRFHVKKGEGLVRDIFSAANIRRLRGRVGVGHVRYPTVGSGGGEDAQPFLVNHPFGIVMAHNGNVANYAELKRSLATDRHRLLASACDVEVILNLFADELSRACPGGFTLEGYGAAVKVVFESVRGAYSVTGYIAGVGLFAFRDPYGIKPIALGEKQVRGGTRALAVASESVVLDLLGYSHLPVLDPGEAILLGEDGATHTLRVSDGQPHPCVFEFVYFARPDSSIDGMSVHEARLRMGRSLARRVAERGLDPEVVMPVPDSARTPAQVIAQELGLPLREGLVKNRYIGRTFIMAGEARRRRSVRHKLNVIESEFAGRNVLLVDDSIVRGTTSTQIIQMARAAGARKVFFASCAPPLRYPCVYGIDMSTRREFIARDRSPDEVARLIGADAVVYQEIDALIEATLGGNTAIANMCAACMSGSYPTGDITAGMFEAIEVERGSP